MRKIPRKFSVDEPVLVKIPDFNYVLECVITSQDGRYKSENLYTVAVMDPPDALISCIKRLKESWIEPIVN